MTFFLKMLTGSVSHYDQNLQKMKWLSPMLRLFSRGERQDSHEEREYMEQFNGLFHSWCHEHFSILPPHIPAVKLQKLSFQSPPCSGVSSDISGLVQYEDLLTLLTCLHCNCLVSPPVAQCRKGHLYCLSCKWVHKLSLQLSSLFKIGKASRWTAARSASRPSWTPPTRRWRRWSGWSGCPASTGTGAAPRSSSSRAGSSTKHSAGSLKSTPTTNNESKGFDRQSANSNSMVVTRFLPTRWFEIWKSFVSSVVNFQDLPWHHKMCPYAHHPHPNILPAMPDRKKGTKRTDAGCGGSENGKDTSEGKVSLTNGASTVATSPSDEKPEAGEGMNSKECITVSDEVTSS